MTRIQRLERLGILFRRMEQVRELELRTAAHAVVEIVNLQTKERMVRDAELRSGRSALTTGDAQERMLAEASREWIDLRMRRHLEVRAVREKDRSVAQAQSTQRRMEREQMEGLLEAQRRAAETVESRRFQAETDDRFLARREWLRLYGPDARMRP